MPLVNQIFITFSVSRIFHLSLLFISLVIFFSYPDAIITSRMIHVINNVWIIVNNFSIWLATCLKVLYFLKIYDFSNSLFLCLKWRVEEVVSATLLVSLVLQILNILLCNLEINICINEYKRNISCNFSPHYQANCQSNVLSFHIIFLSVPFVLSLSMFFSAHFLPVDTSQEDAAACSGRQRCQNHGPLQSLENHDCLSPTILYFYSVCLSTY
jgi:taste receptor type 2